MKKSLVAANTSPTIVGVAAYTGQTVSDYITSFPTANTRAFEPTPSSFAQLQERFGGNNQVKCFNLAVSDVNVVIPFNLNGISRTNWSLKLGAKADKRRGEELLKTISAVSVRSQRRDEICQSRSVDHIVILKLDAQGLELQVLHGP